MIVFGESGPGLSGPALTPQRAGQLRRDQFKPRPARKARTLSPDGRRIQLDAMAASAKRLDPYVRSRLAEASRSAWVAAQRSGPAEASRRRRVAAQPATRAVVNRVSAPSGRVASAHVSRAVPSGSRSYTMTESPEAAVQRLAIVARGGVPMVTRFQDDHIARTTHIFGYRG